MIKINQKKQGISNCMSGHNQWELSIEQESDERLIERYHLGDNRGFILLVARYIEIIDRKLLGYPFLREDAEDIKQEALITFLNAVKTFDFDRGFKFATYAGTCLDNSIRNSIKKSSAKKLQMFQNAVSIDTADHENLLIGNSPEEIYIDKERYLLLLDKINVNLSDFEKNVLFCYLDGKSYHQISASLNSSQKAVDNALQRVRRKLKTVF